MSANVVPFDIDVLDFGTVTSVLQIVFSLCDCGSETEASRGLLHDRFREIWDEFQRLASADDHGPPEDIARDFTHALTAFLAALRPYEYFTDKERVQNLTNLWFALEEGHSAADALCRRLNLPVTDAWRAVWAEDLKFMGVHDFPPAFTHDQYSAGARAAAPSSSYSYAARSVQVARVQVCSYCGTRSSVEGARICTYCRRRLHGNTSPASRRVVETPSSVFSLLDDLEHGSDPEKLLAAMLLYRQSTTSSSLSTTMDARGGRDVLLAIAQDTNNFPRALYAFAVLETLSEATSSPAPDVLESVRERLNENVVDNIITLVNLLSSDDTTQRDVRQAAELSELAARLNPSHKNTLTPVVRGLARALAQSPDLQERDAVLTALVALVKHQHVNDLRAIRELDVDVAPSLLAALASGSPESQYLAIQLLMELTETDVSFALTCGTSHGIRTLASTLEDGDDEMKEGVLAVVANIARVDTMAQRLGSWGIVAIVVEVFRGTASKQVRASVLKTLAVLATDPINAALVELAGGVAGFGDSLARP